MKSLKYSFALLLIIVGLLLNACNKSNTKPKTEPTLAEGFWLGIYSPSAGPAQQIGISFDGGALKFYQTFDAVLDSNKIMPLIGNYQVNGTRISYTWTRMSIAIYLQVRVLLQPRPTRFLPRWS